jgi:hypothetical protein
MVRRDTSSSSQPRNLRLAWVYSLIAAATNVHLLRLGSKTILLGQQSRTNPFQACCRELPFFEAVLLFSHYEEHAYAFVEVEQSRAF